MTYMNSRTALLAMLIGSSLVIAGCDVDKTQEGEMPEVNVQTEAGQLPAYEVETADVDIGTRQETITVPEVDITMPDEQRAERVPAQDPPPRQ